ncbi:MAG: ATP-dependent Clp protease ATP-binding subunit, partial [Firmicutes bacterium]|nr:ATP-dependent Clp protease ATP-binding subunit [Bacillota bacterium]
CEGGGDSVGQMIKPDIARGEISLIGATTTEEYEKYVASDQAFIRRFTVIRIEEPDIELTKKMLAAQSPRYMQDYNTKISDELIGLIVEGAAKIKSRRFPDKAIDALDVACVKATKNRVDDTEVASITRKHIEEALMQLIADDEKMIEQVEKIKAKRKEDILNP